jgi:hypothetical protein
MKNKMTPYLFLVFLTVLLFFILGFRYGQKVENTNKINQIMASIPPSATVAPTQIPFGLKTYNHTGCGLQFFQLNTSEVIHKASNGAMLQEKGKPILSFDCSKNIQTDSVATDSIKLLFQKKTIAATEKDGKYLFQLKHPFSGITVSFFVEKSLYPLLEKSIEFVTK